MPLESLLQLVETLRERIIAHRAALSQSEALTRYALIDPLLRELGWDTSDPTMVVPEYRSGAGRADYALLVNGSPAMMVEAKSLGALLDDAVRIQVLGYCMMVGTNHFSVTNGGRWEIYDTRREGPIDKKRVVAFDLSEPSAAETCLKALALWRPSVQSGQIAGGQVPVVELTPTQTNQPEPIAEVGVSPAPPATIAEPTRPVPRSTHALDQHEWQRLSDVAHTKGHSKPIEVRFPDNSSVNISAWNRIMIESVRWLVNRNFLASNQCPIRSAQRYLVATDQTHPTGKPMTTPVEVNSFYVETNYSASHCVRNAKTIIEHVGQDPAEFKVRFS